MVMKKKKNIFIGTYVLVSIILSITTNATVPTVQLPKFSQILTVKQQATIAEPIRQDQQLYTIELQVTSEEETERKQKFTEALNQVITKNTADQKIIASPTIKSALSNPTTYIQSYTYINRSIIPDKPSLYLQIQFDKTAITQLLQQAAAIPIEQINQTKKIAVRITNVKSLDQYNEVVKYLSTFNQVTQIDLVKTSTEEVILNLNIIGDQPALLTAIDAQNKLTHNAGSTTLPSGIDLDYKWVTNEPPQAIGIKPLS
jgi:hypothetical protein